MNKKWIKNLENLTTHVCSQPWTTKWLQSVHVLIQCMCFHSGPEPLDQGLENNGVIALQSQEIMVDHSVSRIVFILLF